LQGAGIVEAVRQHLALFGERSNVAAELQVVGQESRMGPADEHALLRIVQEALNNIAKHAQATHAAVTIEFDLDRVRCTIRDDGLGFDPAILPTEPTLTGGMGMDTMRSRAAEAGGAFEIESRPGEGTIVTVTLPLAPKEQRAAVGAVDPASL